MTTTTTTETVETVQRLPIEAIVADPANRKADPDAQFLASVRTHGVKFPLLVTPHPTDDGLYRLVAGERRLRAAKKAGHETVPAIVRSLTDQEVLELNLIENIQRQDLKPTQEALAMTRLVELGMSQKTLAKRISRSAAYVRERLRLMELPPAARALIDDDLIGIEQGLALVELVDHPDTMEAVVAQVAAGNRNVEWMVSSALRQLESDARVAEGRAKAEARGLRVVEHEGYHPSGYVELGTYGGLDLDAKAHAKEPCHAVVIAPRDGKATPVCTDKKRHTRKGASPVKTAAKAGADAEARAEKAARKEATEHRRDFIVGVLSARVSKTDVVALVLANYLDDANTNEQAAIAKLLGLEPTDRDRRHDAWIDAVSAYAHASDANLLRACLAFSLVQGEDAIAGGWAHDRGERHRAFLAARGYEPTAYEVAQAEEANRRHEEALARTAEFRAEVARAEEAAADMDSAADDAGLGPDEAEHVDAEPAGEGPFDDAG